MPTPTGSNPRIKTLRDWDYATLTKARFLAKYGANAKEYAQPSAPTAQAAQAAKASTVAPVPQPISTTRMKPIVDKNEQTFHPTPPLRINGERTQ